MGKYESLAKDIIKEVGGQENINAVTHCITRLRFTLKDEAKANDEALKAMGDVVTVVHSGGQYQVVIGQKVNLVYADVCEVLGITDAKAAEAEEAPTEKKGFVATLIDIISSCFAPILGPMVACGLMKGINALLVFLLGATYSASGTYLVLNAIGDAIFYFMPVMLGYSSSKKFNLNPVVGMLIGAALCMPALQSSSLSAKEVLGSAGMLGNYYITFLKIPVIATSYTSSVIPVVVVCAFAGMIQKYAKKFVPELVQSFLVPFIVMVISIPVGLIVIGPVIQLFTTLLSNGFTALFNFSPVLTGIVLGFFWQVLIIFGLHWSAVPVAMINIAAFGYDTLLMVTHPTAFAQFGALLGMYVKMKDKKKKAQAVPAMISAAFGVTEPSIYGFTLAAKTPFIASLVAGAVGNMLMCVLGAKRYIMGAGGIVGLVNYVAPDGSMAGVVVAVIAMLAAIAVGFGLTMLLWKDDSKEA
ncbi:MAG: PTS transporter subunit EIIC [Erysipelotrichaceae bacterium]|nr:PTS transporter subunit EIIC [Erysipelotrichaceae bacterium]